MTELICFLYSLPHSSHQNPRPLDQLQIPGLDLCMLGSATIYNQLPELLELLYFAECSSLFSIADRFDFFKNKKREAVKAKNNHTEAES